MLRLHRLLSKARPLTPTPSTHTPVPLCCSAAMFGTSVRAPCAHTACAACARRSTRILHSGLFRTPHASATQRGALVRCGPSSPVAASSSSSGHGSGSPSEEAGAAPASWAALAALLTSGTTSNFVCALAAFVVCSLASQLAVMQLQALLPVFQMAWTAWKWVSAKLLAKNGEDTLDLLCDDGKVSGRGVNGSALPCACLPGKHGSWNPWRHASWPRSPLLVTPLPA